MANVFETLLAQLSIEELEAQRDLYLSDADEARARADAIDKLIAIKKRLGPTVPDTASANGGERGSTVPLETLVRDAERPGVAEAILRIMNEQDEALWTAEALLARMSELGWAPRGRTPKNSISATLSRLRSNGEVEREDAGTYKLAAHKRRASRPEDPGREEHQLTVGEGG